MLLDWQAAKDGQAAPNIPIDTLSSETSLAHNDIGLPTAALIPLAGLYGLKLQLATLTLDSIDAELAAGRPVVALIAYGTLLQRENQADHFGHFVVVVGSDTQNVYLNDPDWWNQGAHKREDGHNWAVPREQFVQAMEQSPVRGQGLIVPSPPAALTPDPSPKGEGSGA
jgi:uncharacterized protein YvpB